MLDFQLQPFAQVLRALEQDFSPAYQKKSAQSFWSLEEDDKSFYLLLDAPGVNKEEIDIELVGQELVVKWSPEASSRKVIAGSIRPKNFENRFKMSDQVDSSKIEANYLNGVLELKIGKKDSSISRKILISDASISGDNLKN